MAKVTIGNLSGAIKDVLSEYGDEVSVNLSQITQKVAQAGAKALRSEARSKFDGTGKYAKGWKVTTQEGRLYTAVTIHNSLPGLPHLLEHGHAKRGGGRVQGRAHIAPVEKELIADFEREVVAKL